jgi:hypothetical protein
MFATAAGGRGDVAASRVMALARPVSVTVKDAPLAGRPESYGGAVGRFQVDCQLRPTQVQVGQPMTCALTLRGEGTLDRTVAPDLTRVTGVADNFKVYESTATAVPGGKQFTYSLRPLQAEVTQFPPIPLSYFDVDQEAYVTLQTAAIPVRVSEAEQLRSEDIARAAAPSGGPGSLQSRREGIFANMTQPRQFVDRTVQPGFWAALVAALATVQFLAVAVVPRLRRQAADTGRQRRRGAASRARRQLRSGTESWRAGRNREAAQLWHDMIVGFVADVGDAIAAGMTNVDVQAALRQWGLSESLVRRVDQFLQHCDAVRFGSAGGSSLDREAETLLEDLLQACRQQKRCA